MHAQLTEKTTGLRDHPNDPLKLSHWQNRLTTVREIFHAQTVLLLQYMPDTQVQVLSYSSAAEIPTEFEDIASMLQHFAANPAKTIKYPLHWSNGKLFGELLILNGKPKVAMTQLQSLLEPMLALLKSELRQLQLMEQMASLSLQDELTGMLNPRGFNLLAPRQLSLSRRLGSHAGLLLLEGKELNSNRIAGLQQDKALKILARVILENMREADICTRLNKSQFIILAFVDNQAHLDILTSRLKKQVSRSDCGLQLLVGKSFFAPDSHFELSPMLELAKQDLLQYKPSS
ncbi:diguanylate cyclase domain-containing protein [Shewanella chilikensis]|uniref:diguanylate cyclase domain-containing protein n=1 Tax=Shewanella chilikensis TaxID=558541 RepID=UPI001F3B36AA|nr:diguanylate cyclase [Shewanella chilikensis]MCE9788280.1 diguanylate cyclase [Shewanella chilikensis]